MTQGKTTHTRPKSVPRRSAPSVWGIIALMSARAAGLVGFARPLMVTDGGGKGSELSPRARHTYIGPGEDACDDPTACDLTGLCCEVT